MNTCTLEQRGIKYSTDPMNNQPDTTKQGWVNIPPLPTGATMNQTPYAPGPPSPGMAIPGGGGPPTSGREIFNPSAPPSGGFNNMPTVLGTNAPVLSSSSAPVPPMLDQPGFASFPGFADSTLDPTIQPPRNPFFNPADTDIPSDYKRSIPLNVSALSEEEVFLALKKYADLEICAGPPEEISIGKIEIKNAYKYQLNTFTEQRRTAWQLEPFFNQTVEGPTMIPIGPWDIKVFPDAMFANQEKKIQIPNTSSVRPCHKCFGNGRERCHHCDGVGWKKCTWCNGSGRRNDGSDCISCDGGRHKCTWCNGNGYKKCIPCNERGQLFMYLQLIVTWKSHLDEFISDSNTIPKELLSKTKGSSVISEQNRVVYPFIDFPDQAIVNSSKELIAKHARDYTAQSVILEQKQTVDLVRIAEVEYTHNDKNGKFHIFGETNEVHFPDYPCCWSCCCTIS